jgi:hypothetical protein
MAVSTTCAYCGAPSAHGATFCGSCGRQLRPAEAPTFMAAGPPPTAAPQHAPLARRTVDAATLLELAGSLVVCVGSLMAWATVTIFGLQVTKSGTDGDGSITLVVGLIMAILALVGLLSGRRLGIPVLIGALLALAVALYDILDIQSRAGTFGGSDVAVDVSVGPGLWVTAVGAALAAGAAGFDIARRRRV